MTSEQIDILSLDITTSEANAIWWGREIEWHLIGLNTVLHHFQPYFVLQLRDERFFSFFLWSKTSTNQCFADLSLSVPPSGEQRRLLACGRISYSEEQIVNDHFRKGWGEARLHQGAGVRDGWSVSTDDIWKVWIHENTGVVLEIALSSSYNAHLLTVNTLLDTLHISCKWWMSFPCCAVCWRLEMYSG